MVCPVLRSFRRVPAKKGEPLACGGLPRRKAETPLSRILLHPRRSRVPSLPFPTPQQQATHRPVLSRAPQANCDRKRNLELIQINLVIPTPLEQAPESLLHDGLVA